MKRLMIITTVLVLALAALSGCAGRGEDGAAGSVPDLTGIWHASESVGAGYATLYHFYEDGTYLYSANEMYGADRVRRAAGTWRQEGEWLCLTPAKLLYIDGGVVVDGWGSVFYEIVGGEPRLITVPEGAERLPDEVAFYANPPYLPIRLRVEEIRSTERASVLIDGGRFYAFYSTPWMEEENAAFLSSETVEDYYAAQGYDPQAYPEDDPEQYESGQVPFAHLTGEGAGRAWVSDTQRFEFYGGSWGRRTYRYTAHAPGGAVLLETKGDWWVDGGVLYLSAKTVDGKALGAQNRELEACTLQLDRALLRSGRVVIDGVLFEQTED